MSRVSISLISSGMRTKSAAAFMTVHASAGRRLCGAARQVQLAHTGCGKQRLREMAPSWTARISRSSRVRPQPESHRYVDWSRKHRPNVALMDLQMPDVSGIEAMIGIRSEFADARIIVLMHRKATVRSTELPGMRSPCSST